MKLNVFCNVTQRRAEATETGSSWAWPDFTAGDRVKISFRFTEQIGSSRVVRELAVRSARLTLGAVDAPPVSGRFALKVGSGLPGVGNTTPLLMYNISERALEETLNALADVQGSGLGPCRVWTAGGSFFIQFADGSDPGVSVPVNTLEPRAFVRVLPSVVGGAMVLEMRLMQAPLAQAPVFTREVPQAPWVETLQDGAVDGSGTVFVPEIQRLTIPSLFRGSFVLRSGVFAKSAILDVDADTEGLAEALEGLYAAQGYKPTVRSEGDGRFLVVFQDQLSLGLDVPQMVVEVFSAPQGDVTFDLDLDTGEVFAALRTEAVRKDFYLELEAEVCDDGENPADPLVTARTVTLLQQKVTLRREVAWDGDMAAALVDWQRPPVNRDYVPFTLDQVITGQQQAFVCAVGDGDKTEWVVDHGLGTEAVQASVLDNVTGRRLRDDEYEMVVSSGNSVILTFPTAPPEEGLGVLVSAIGPASVFQSHTHTIAQVVNLQNYLDDLAQRVTTLEAILPTVTVGVVASAGGSIEVPIPEATEALFYRGGDEVKIEEDKPLVLPKRAPYLLPAIHTESNSTSLPDPLPDPTLTAPGTLWINDSGDAVLVPGGGGTRSGWVADDGFVGCDGRVLYPTTRDGATKSYYPSAFERELFAFFVSEKMLATRRMEVVFGITVGLVGATSRASWLLEIQAGTAPQDVSPATTGPNLQDVLWNATPILRERLVLTQELVTHTFGTRIKNTLDGMVCDVQNYGLWTGNNAAAPAGPNFALRARLIAFDTENSRPDARGWVVYRLAGVSSGEAAAKLAAVIA